WRPLPRATRGGPRKRGVFLVGTPPETYLEEEERLTPSDAPLPARILGARAPSLRLRQREPSRLDARASRGPARPGRGPPLLPLRGQPLWPHVQAQARHHPGAWPLGAPPAPKRRAPHAPMIP